jgi:hypothetical protein
MVNPRPASVQESKDLLAGKAPRGLMPECGGFRSLLGHPRSVLEIETTFSIINEHEELE